MDDARNRPSLYSFANFKLDVRSGELRKNGTRIRLQDQPLQILLLLLDRPGELVSREEIQKKLWPDGTFVDFDNAINTAVRKLRESLGDDSGDRRFIETLSRRGYRFIGSLESPSQKDEALPTVPPDPPRTPIPKKSKKEMIAVLCGTCLVVTGGWWWWHWPGLETSILQLKPIPLTAAQGIEADASFSPDGNEVVYSWDEGEKDVSHIFVKLIGSGTPLRLTTGITQDSSPAWSPDGHRVAFLRKQVPHGDGISEINANETQLYVMPALGSAARMLCAGYFGRSLKWSPDGRFLIVSYAPSASDLRSLYLVDAENGEKLRLTTPPNSRTSDWAPAFAPGGRVLAFLRNSGWNHGLYVLDFSKDFRPVIEPKLLNNLDVDIGEDTAWTSDGKDLIYSLYEDHGVRRLMRMRAKSGEQPRPLTPVGESAYQPAISLRGNRLAYTKVLSNSDILQIRPGSPSRSFASSTRYEDSPQYSADGNHIAFDSNRSGHSQIWACDRDGRNPAQLTGDDLGIAGSPRWSPDGRWITFDSVPKGKGDQRVFVMAADGSHRHPLTAEDDAGEAVPSWSRDGEWIYYSCDRTGRSEIWKVSAKGGKGIRITHNGGWVSSESCDKQTLYYVKGDISALWELPVQGGKEKRVLESIYQRAFAVVEDGIYYIPTPTVRGRASIRFHRFDTSEDREIDTINHEPYLGLTVSPDRRSILATVYTPTRSENIMIADNFR